MGTKRDQRFYERVWKRLNLMGRARQSKEATTILIEECRNSQEVLNPSLLALERELEGMCYAEYAYMTPYQRDQAFIVAMNSAAKAFWGSHRILDDDDETAPELKFDWVYTDIELNVPEVRSAIRSARQHFDAMGLQYRPAIAWIIGERILYQGGHGMPRPNQLYSHLALEALEQNDSHVRDRFDAPFASGPIDPRFLASNHTGHWAQKKALDAIESYVRGAFNRTQALGRYLAEGLISDDEARYRFGNESVDEAIAAHGTPRFLINGGAVNPPRTESRACIGLSYDPSADVCANCPVQGECIEITDRVRLAQLSAHGVEDPRTQFQRQDAAARQRNARLKRTPESEAWAASVRDTIARIFGLRMKGRPPSRKRPGRKGGNEKPN